MSNTLPFAHYNSDGSLIADPKALVDRPEFTAQQRTDLILIADAFTQVPAVRETKEL